jgi:hypothetical protein
MQALNSAWEPVRRLCSEQYCLRVTAKGTNQNAWKPFFNTEFILKLYRNTAKIVSFFYYIYNSRNFLYATNFLSINIQILITSAKNPLDRLRYRKFDRKFWSSPLFPTSVFTARIKIVYVLKLKQRERKFLLFLNNYRNTLLDQSMLA